MAVTITKRPEHKLEGNHAVRWVSIIHPIVFSLQGQAIDETARPNYGIVVQIREVGTESLIARTKPYKPGGDNPFEINVSGYLRHYIKRPATSPSKIPSPGVINTRDEGQAIQFYIETQEVWQDFEGALVKDTVMFFAANIKPQIGAPFGENLAEYTLVYGQVAEENKAKFLSVFKEPMYFRGHPFLLSFVYPKEFRNVELQLVEKRLTRNNDEYADLFTQLDKRQTGGINRTHIRENYAADVWTLDVYIRSGQSADADYYEPGFIELGFID